MAFKRIKGSDRGMQERAISSTAFAVGDLLVYDRSNAIVITASAASEIDNLAGVCAKATTTSDTVILLQKIIAGDMYEVDALNTIDAGDNYMRMIWGAGQTIDNSGTDVPGDTGIFMQTAITTTGKVVGEFVTGSLGD